MKKLFLVLLTALFLSGCINITEEIFLEKNGSGKYAMTMDLEKAVEMMDMLKSFAPDSLAGDMKEGNILDSVKDNFKVFDSIPGITNVKKEQKGNVFTDEMIDAYIELKMEDVMRTDMTPHPVEFDMYYSV